MLKTEFQHSVSFKVNSEFKYQMSDISGWIIRLKYKIQNKLTIKSKFQEIKFFSVTVYFLILESEIDITQPGAKWKWQEFLK